MHASLFKYQNLLCFLTIKVSHVGHAKYRMFGKNIENLEIPPAVRCISFCSVLVSSFFLILLLRVWQKRLEFRVLSQERRSSSLSCVALALRAGPLAVCGSRAS